MITFYDHRFISFASGPGSAGCRVCGRRVMSCGRVVGRGAWSRRGRVICRVVVCGVRFGVGRVRLCGHVCFWKKYKDKKEHIRKKSKNPVVIICRGFVGRIKYFIFLYRAIRNI